MNTSSELVIETPLEKLARSRARVLDALTAATQEPRHGAKISKGVLSGILGMLWEHHPLGNASQAASDAVEELVVPWVRKHPFGAVAGAALVGGLMVWGRPWRWIRASSLLAGLLPQLFSKFMAHREMQKHQSTDQR